MAITYQTLYDQVLTQIKSACQNVSNYSQIPAAYKSGYREIIDSTGSPIRKTAILTISTPISQVGTSAVESDFKAYMNASGFGTTVSLSSVADARGKMYFFQAVAGFINKNVCFVQGRNQTKCIVYMRYYTSGSTGTSVKNGTLIVGDDVNNLNNVLSNIISNNARKCTMNYSIRFLGNGETDPRYIYYDFYCGNSYTTYLTLTGIPSGQSVHVYGTIYGHTVVQGGAEEPDTYYTNNRSVDKYISATSNGVQIELATYYKDYNSKSYGMNLTLQFSNITVNINPSSWSYKSRNTGSFKYTN